MAYLRPGIIFGQLQSINQYIIQRFGDFDYVYFWAKGHLTIFRSKKKDSIEVTRRTHNTEKASRWTAMDNRRVEEEEILRDREIAVLCKSNQSNGGEEATRISGALIPMLQVTRRTHNTEKGSRWTAMDSRRVEEEGILRDREIVVIQNRIQQLNNCSNNLPRQLPDSTTLTTPYTVSMWGRPG
ncbi:hypothetical protein Cgig2_016063 [Carnegiea gigantea]|uniref:Uncharacterized protein n=1 Tax=Carnegiea gigantea TaxID=171969 RepID=A0A9Q1Q836_9CARY|nr:hypothetical protein Cgig2_016063 [Carnegiea gigantea]